MLRDASVCQVDSPIFFNTSTDIIPFNVSLKKQRLSLAFGLLQIIIAQRSGLTVFDEGRLKNPDVLHPPAGIGPVFTRDKQLIQPMGI